MKPSNSLLLKSDQVVAEVRTRTSDAIDLALRKWLGHQDRDELLAWQDEYEFTTKGERRQVGWQVGPASRNSDWPVFMDPDWPEVRTLMREYLCWRLHSENCQTRDWNSAPEFLKTAQALPHVQSLLWRVEEAAVQSGLVPALTGQGSLL